MKVLRLALLVAWPVMLSGCYAAKIDSGLPPSDTVIKKTFAASWIFGLVPPSTVETAAQCPGGVAIVETQLSFLNQVVGFLTIGIYTPMQIVVTCAEAPATTALEGTPNFMVSSEASSEQVQAVFMRAAEEAVMTGKPVLVYTTE